MSPALANLINAIVLIGMGTWGYFESGSFTALIPAGFGVALAAMYPGVAAHNKVIAHIAVVVTLVVFIALFRPLFSQIGKGDAMGIIRVGAMVLTSLLAMVFFVKSFIDARKARLAGEAENAKGK